VSDYPKGRFVAAVFLSALAAPVVLGIAALHFGIRHLEGEPEYLLPTLFVAFYGLQVLLGAVTLQLLKKWGWHSFVAFTVGGFLFNAFWIFPMIVSVPSFQVRRTVAALSITAAGALWGLLARLILGRPGWNP
jgi:hypothetical protein